MASNNDCPADEAYEQREGTENKGAEYEFLIPTLFAVRCIFREDIKNIRLACNVEGFGAFDDVFLNVEYTNGTKYLCVIQLKHVKGPIKISSFTDENDKNFNFCKYYKSFQAIEKICGVSELLKNVTLKDIDFFIYTIADLIEPTSKLSIPKLNMMLENVDIDENKLFNTATNAKGNIYKFRSEETHAGIYSTFSAKFYWLLKQANATEAEQLIQNVISAKFEHIDDNLKILFTDYIKAMTTASQRYVLQKHDLQIKLIEMILTPYIVEPTVSVQMENMQLWNEIVDEVDIVMFQHDTEDVAAKIWSIINEKVAQYFNTTIPDTSGWFKPINKDTKKCVAKYKDQYMESLLRKQVGPNGIITLKSLYVVLWKAGIVPLFLRAKDSVQRTNIAKAIGLLKTTASKTRFIVIDRENFKNKHVQNLSIFRNVADLSAEKVAALEKVKVNLQGRKRDTTLTQIIGLHEDIKATISSDLLLQLVHGTTIIGKKLDAALEYYIERHIMKPAVHVSALRELKGSMFVILGTTKAISNLKPLLEGYFDFDLPYVSERKSMICNGTERIILTTKTDTFQIICNIVKDKNIHKLSIHDENLSCLEWLDTKGCMEELQAFRTYNDEFSLLDGGLLDGITHRTVIMSANPGMGKSALINKLALNCASDFWVIKFNIGDHIQNVNQTNFFDYFYTDTTPILQEFTKATFLNSVKLKKVCIFADGFDEVLGTYLDDAKQLLEYLKEENFYLWIAARPIARQHLESLFNILSLELKPFTEANQEKFLEKFYYSKTGSENDFSHFTREIRGVILNSFSNWKEDFTGNPLQIRMIAELLLSDNSKASDRIDLISLYEHFIDNKLNIYWKKLYGNSPTAQLQARIGKETRKLKDQHTNVAVTLFYERDLLETVLDYDDLEEFLNDIKTGTENVGIITGVTENLEPTFEHRSFAEYLTAKWLAERWRKKKNAKFLFRIFERDSREVRQFFDRMMATNFTLHTAFLNCDIKKVESLLSDVKSAQLVDEGGRTVLHLAASWRTRHIFPKGNTEHLNTQEHYTEEPLITNCKTILKKFLTSGIPPLQKDNLMGWSALEYADKTDCVDAVEEISLHLQHTDLTNLNIFNYTNSLLYYCAKYAYINIFKAVADHSLIYNEVNQTLVHVASQSGNTGILKCMLDDYRPTYKPVINVRDELGCTPLYYTCKGPTVLEESDNSNNDSNYTKCVEMLIEENAEININTESGYIPLHAAAEYGNLDILKMLIEAGSTIDYFSINESTPLHIAAYKGHSSCIAELAHHGADVNVHNTYGQTPIWFAAILGHTEALKELLKLKADCNKCNHNGEAPVLIAVLSQHVECVKVLISEGAHVNCSDDSSLSPLYVAAKTGNREILKILIKAKADVNQGREQVTPLHVAACGGHLDCVRLLLGNGAKINAQNSEGSTPLHECAREGHVDVLKFLVKSRARVNSITDTGNAPLHLAAEMGHVDNIRELIKSRANVNLTTNNGGTPLNIAAYRGYLDIMKLLIDANAMINLPAGTDTPLHLACFSGHVNCVNELVERGAVANVKNHLGITPLHVAAKEGHPEIIDILIRTHNAQLKRFGEETANIPASPRFIDQLTNCGASPLTLAISAGHTKCMSSLILNGANVNIKDGEGYTPLFSAVSNGYFNVVKLLIESGASVNEEIVNNLTPLSAAVIGNRIDIVKLLVEHKANVNVKSDTGLTALHIAVYRGYFDVVQYLVANGAVLVKNNIGETPLDLAINMYSSEHEISYFLSIIKN